MIPPPFFFLPEYVVKGIRQSLPTTLHLNSNAPTKLGCTPQDKLSPSTLPSVLCQLGVQKLVNTAICIINIHSLFLLTKRAPTLFGSSNTPS